MAVFSMTGFGQSQTAEGTLTINVEIKSVNNRFLDINPKLPSLYSKFEQDIVKLIKSKLKRGRVDIYINRKEEDWNEKSENALNDSLFNTYLGIYRKAIKLSGLNEVLTLPQLLPDILNRKDIITSVTKEVNSSAELAPLIDATSKALEALIAQRASEGEALEKDILNHISLLAGITEKISSHSQENAANYKEKLKQRIEKLETDVALDPQRLAQEVAIFADRIDISEEIIRLNSHFEQFQKIIKSEQEIGKKLEFLSQEILREFNTSSSKSQNIAIANLVIEAKAIVEKIKEQILNIE